MDLLKGKLLSIGIVLVCLGVLGYTVRVAFKIGNSKPSLKVNNAKRPNNVNQSSDASRTFRTLSRLFNTNDNYRFNPLNNISTNLSAEILEKRELRKSQMRSRLLKQLPEAIIAEYDLDNNGTLSQSEGIQAFEKLRTEKQQKILDEFDIDFDGLISKDEKDKMLKIKQQKFLETQ